MPSDWFRVATGSTLARGQVSAFRLDAIRFFQGLYAKL